MTKNARKHSKLDPFLKQFLEEHTYKSVRREVNTRSPSVSATKPVGRSNRRLLFSLPILGAILGTAATISWPYLAPGPASRPISRLSAVVVDELSLTDPDPTFLANATGSLTTAGYHVDYYSPPQVTVGFFQTFPLGYGLLISKLFVDSQCSRTLD